MSPEACLTSDNQSKKVLDWVIVQKRGKIIQMAAEVEVNGIVVHRDRKPMIAIVNKEPLVVSEGPLPGTAILFCSNNHAKELEKAGIVKFPEPAPRA